MIRLGVIVTIHRDGPSAVLVQIVSNQFTHPVAFPFTNRFPVLAMSSHGTCIVSYSLNVSGEVKRGSGSCRRRGDECQFASYSHSKRPL